MGKTKVIFIYGAPAVGKLTTAKELVERTGFKLLHNHLTTDLVRAIFDRGNDTGTMLITRLRFEMLEIAVKEKVEGIVMTGVHAHNFLYPNGENDEWFIKRCESITEDNGGEFYGINLITGKEKLMERVIGEDRLQWKKIHKKEVLEDTLNQYDFSKTAPLNHNSIIDNTNTSAKGVVEKIIELASLSTLT
ncbi:MAG: AAA family ATPase [bacterium]|nr:AAA family ATPase [bacterium]